MNKSSTTIMKMIVMVVAIAVAATMTTAQPATQDCVSKLADCAESLNSTKPAAECCNSIKEAVATQLSCLCNLYTTPGLLSTFGVSVPQALNLTTHCGVPIKLDQCNSTTPAESPKAQSTPGVGEGKNGSEKMAIGGFLTVFLFFVSTLFY